jgi:two-component system CheB/CheR fusion protein
MTDASVTAPNPSVSMPVVAVGASAGGLEALEAFFDAAPVDAGIAYVVVQHLSPDYKSLMVELLSKHTAMPVLRIEDAMPVAADHVYLIPPRKNLVVRKGLLRLVEQDSGHHPNLPIDQFMESLAEDAGPLAVGVVLSGTGSDGTRGIRAIKEAGGMVVVQDERTAKFDGMPRSALATGLADLVLPPEQIAKELVRWFKSTTNESLGGIHLLLARDGQDLERVLEIVRGQAGIDFTLYKRSTVVRRVERRMAVNQSSTVADYIAHLYQNPREVQILAKELLIGVTRFFRDAEAFAVLDTQVVPALVRKVREGESLRCWVAGCSTGEEAYSLAITIAEAMDAAGRQIDVKIFATDVDRDAIEKASTGDYPESICADVSPKRLERYFTRISDGWRIAKRIRDMVVFAPHNITRDPPFYRIDLISCRNLLIYLQPQVQKKILSLFHFALNRDGFLWLGSSESLGDLERVFAQVDPKWKVFANRGDVRPYLAEHIARDPHVAAPAVRVRVPSEDRTATQIQQQLVARFVPPSVVVSELGDIIHVNGDVRRFLEFSSGTANLTLSRLITPALSVPVSTALARARKDRQEIIYKDVPLSAQGESLLVSVSVQPLVDSRQNGELMLISFATASAPQVEGRVFTAPDNQGERMRDLEIELQHTRENLQAAIEELETTNEELQATNEELLAANEELQSTNEELQSVNEELYTVNSEYQAKIAELTELNHDIDTYLSNTSIGAIYLDRQLCIRKFTPAVASQINVMDRDIGRPLGHISHNLDGVDPVAEATAALATGRPRDREVVGNNGRRYMARFTAYNSAAGDLKGAMISFVDITVLRTETDRMADAYRGVDGSLAAIMVLDHAGDIRWTNPRTTDLTGYEAAQLKGCSPRILLDRGSPEDAMATAWAVVQGGAAWRGVFPCQRRDGTVVQLAIQVIPCLGQTGGLAGATLIALPV